VAEDPAKVRADRTLPPLFEGRDRHLVDQLAEVRRLGQDLDVEERGDRLERDRPELLATMEAAGRMDVVDGYGEDQLPGEPAEPAAKPLQPSDPACADDVVAMIDGFEQRIEVLRGPGRACRRHEDDRHLGPGKSTADGLVPAKLFGRDDDRLHGAPSRGQQLLERGRDGRGRRTVIQGQDDYPNRSSRERIAPEVGLEGIEEVVRGRRHSASRRSAQTGCGASQRSTAAR
jgi:hypothetical protein